VFSFIGRVSKFEYFKGKKFYLSMWKSILSFLLILFFFSNCSPLKQYSSPSYAWAEAEIKIFEAMDASVEYADNSLLFIGSSSIRMWDTLAEDMAPFPVIKRGYGGAHLRDAIFYTHRVLGEHEPAMIIGFIANDIKGVQEDERPGKVKRLFAFFLKQVRERHPETPFLWIEITPTKSRWKQWEEIKRVNKKIKAYCEKMPNVYFVETAEAFLNENGLPSTELFIEDQLHLNKEGYALWSSIIKKEIEQYLN
jgi:hypothetical protein